ncbi:TIGR03862 family flavoprotein [Xanthobacter pseudotagetidis]|uniref:TIGR03862 family flavoprotein n=1 Tax=Xanthobacter pseudotagetidis TaxID=3119911 RepID=UPI00372680C9
MVCENDAPLVSIVGAGPAGLAAAERLAGAGFRVAVHDRMPSLARKFLMAGRGGLNLTHSEPFERLVSRYGEAGDQLQAALAAFPPSALMDWAQGLGEETFVGTSGRVFPKSFKASPLLRAWLARLSGAGVTFHARHAWRGWDEAGRLLFDTPEGAVAEAPAATVLALGGASWPRLGSDGAWAGLLREKGVRVTDFAPANMGIKVPWSEPYRASYAGAPLKRIALAIDGVRVRGEAMVTEEGLEGGAVYALSKRLRRATAAGPARLIVDLRPDVEEDLLAARFAAAPRKLSFPNLMRKAAGLAPPAAGLVREAMGPDAPRSAEALAALVKALPVTVTGTSGLARAISTAGGIAWPEVAADYSLRARPDTFVCGEMIDWEAPTGGYLLQACFSTGRAAAEGVLARLTP